MRLRAALSAKTLRVLLPGSQLGEIFAGGTGALGRIVSNLLSSAQLFIPVTHLGAAPGISSVSFRDLPACPREAARLVGPLRAPLCGPCIHTEAGTCTMGGFCAQCGYYRHIAQCVCLKIAWGKADPRHPLRNMSLNRSNAIAKTACDHAASHVPLKTTSEIPATVFSHCRRLLLICRSCIVLPVAFDHWGFRSSSRILLMRYSLHSAALMSSCQLSKNANPRSNVGPILNSEPSIREKLNWPVPARACGSSSRRKSNGSYRPTTRLVGVLWMRRLG